MIGSIAMEVSEAEIIAAIQFYLNHSVFTAQYDSRKYHRVYVTSVRQRSSGRFVIEFDGQPEPEFKVEEIQV